MKLENLATLEVLTLPNDMLWEDEFDWSPILADHAYSTTGALFVDQWVKQAGRPISLRAPQEDMAFVTRSTAQSLLDWSGLVNTNFKLTFEYPTDSRSFTVIFDNSGEQSVTAVPAKGFAGHRDGDWFRVTIKFTEV